MLVETFYSVITMKKAILKDEKRVVDILTQSFAANRSVKYVISPQGNRVAKIKALMSYSFQVCMEFGEVWMSKDKDACALILFPERKRFSLRAAWWDLKLAFEAIGIKRNTSVCLQNLASQYACIGAARTR